MSRALGIYGGGLGAFRVKDSEGLGLWSRLYAVEGVGPLGFGASRV